MGLPLSPAQRERQENEARERALREWRLQDLTVCEKAWRSKERGMEQLLSGVFQKLRLDERRHESKILELWANLVDPQIAKHCQPVGLAKGTLFVSVDSSAWLSEIVRYRRPEILERVQMVLGKTVVKKISFRVG
ncbi:MAG TPA: DUF721 domain-containing protein [Candidatus Limnocylindria bacterium]|jgi:predicted nucleic acid-binding Zn ribbon protein|nr:DUF721 domain-containing protein [Candidatus Limnocylindria bacterium]